MTSMATPHDVTYLRPGPPQWPHNGDVKETLKFSIFVVQKAAAPKNGVKFFQGSIGTIRSSLATPYDIATLGEGCCCCSCCSCCSCDGWRRKSTPCPFDLDWAVVLGLKFDKNSFPNNFVSRLYNCWTLVAEHVLEDVQVREVYFLLVLGWVSIILN